MDTSTKRLSAVNLASPWRGALLLPSGTITSSAMLALLYLYTGISASVEQTEYVIIGPIRSFADRVQAISPNARAVTTAPEVNG